MNHFSYLLFKTAFLSVKGNLHFQRWLHRNKQEFPDTVIKNSYKYWSEDHHKQECNIYLPSGEDSTKCPFIIDIHGGCWLYGDKDVYDTLCADWVDMGFTVSTLTYRTIDKVYLKDQIQDVFAFLHFLEEDAKELGISLDHVMLTGDSAGGQLSFLTLAINQSEKLQHLFNVTPVNIDFTCLVLTHPVCFIDEAGRLPSAIVSENCSIPGLQRIMYGRDYKNTKHHFHTVNPRRYIKKGMHFPPILLVSSQGDRLYKNQTFMLAKVLEEADIPYSLYYEADPKALHVFNVTDPNSPLGYRCNTYIADFFVNQILNRQEQVEEKGMGKGNGKIVSSSPVALPVDHPFQTLDEAPDSGPYAKHTDQSGRKKKRRRRSRKQSQRKLSNLLHRSAA